MPRRELVEVRQDGKLRYNFSHPQRLAWKSHKRFILLLGGNQSGKSAFGPLWLHREITRCGPGDYLVVGPTLRLLNAKSIPVFRLLFERILQLGTYVGQPKFMFEFSEEGDMKTFGSHDPLQPTRVVFAYAENPDSVESYTAKAVWMDEAGQDAFKEGTWEALQRRLSLAAGWENDEEEGDDLILMEDGLPGGRALITTTPYSFNWLKRRIYDKWMESELVETLDLAFKKRGKILHFRPERRNHPYYDVIRFESILNPAFSLREYERARDELPDWKFGLFYEARFTRPAGMIYDVFNEERHTYDPKEIVIPDSWKKRYLGLDFGGVNTGAVFLALNPNDKRYYIYKSYKGGRKTAKDLTTVFLQGEPQFVRENPSKLIAVGGAGSEDNWRREFGAVGLNVIKPPISGADSVEVGITKVYTLFKLDKLRISKDLTGLIDEIMSYSRELDDNNEPTEAIANKATYHLLDSLRYIASYISMVGQYPDTPPIQMDYVNSAQPQADYNYSPFHVPQNDAWWGDDYGMGIAVA